MGYTPLGHPRSPGPVQWVSLDKAENGKASPHPGSGGYYDLQAFAVQCKNIELYNRKRANKLPHIALLRDMLHLIFNPAPA